jgi:inner membrane protease subunit 2
MNSQLQPDFCNTCFTKLLVQVPKGHCWVEGDNAEVSLDSKSFGPVSFSEGFGASFSCCSLRYFWFGMQIPLALLKGRVTNVIWPPSRFGRVESHLPEGRVLSQNRGMRP